jgi:hypothetical protein
MKTYARIQDGIVAEKILPAIAETDFMGLSAASGNSVAITVGEGGVAGGTVGGDSSVGSFASATGGADGGELVVIVAAGDEIPISLRFHADIVAALREVPAGVTVNEGDSYSEADGFGPPPPAPAPTAAEVLVARDALLREATLRIAPLQDAVDLDDATASEVAALKAWKQHRVALSRLEQQAGFPAAVDWPKAPV